MDKKHDASIRHRSLTGRPLLGSLAVLLALAVVVALSGRSGLPAIAVAQEALLDPVAVVNEVGPTVVTVLNKQREEHLLLPATEEVAGSGSGFFLDEQGHIVTNSHVVADGDAFEVILADGSARQATLVGEDSISDLAVLQVEGSVPAVAPLGDSAAVEPGQPVLAIGSALGSFTNTVTGGIVSAIGRSLGEDPTNPSLHLTNLIQHDAAINPGNSGGPLVDMAGQVVGVNTLAITGTEASLGPIEVETEAQGLFFAIPANAVARISAELIANGQVVYPYLGLSDFVELTPGLAGFFGLSVDHGVYAVGVEPNGPAAQAGIQEGDIIVAIDGTEIDEATSLTDVLFQHRAGDTVQVTVARDGSEQTLAVTLGTRPAS